jgi:hypothetical protein
MYRQPLLSKSTFARWRRVLRAQSLVQDMICYLKVLFDVRAAGGARSVLAYTRSHQLSWAISDQSLPLETTSYVLLNQQETGS